MHFNIKGYSVINQRLKYYFIQHLKSHFIQKLISRKLIGYVNQMDPLYFLYFGIKCIRLIAEALATDVRQDRVN